VRGVPPVLDTGEKMSSTLMPLIKLKKYLINKSVLINMFKTKTNTPIPDGPDLIANGYKVAECLFNNKEVTEEEALKSYWVFLGYDKEWVDELFEKYKKD
jgi:hypothetical protein